MHQHHRQNGLDQRVLWAECDISPERSTTMTQVGQNNPRTSKIYISKWISGQYVQALMHSSPQIRIHRILSV